MKAKAQAEHLDHLFDALAHEHRRGIIVTLSLQPASISQLALQRDLSLPAIHKHVKVLEDSGIVKRQKVGRTTFLTLNRSSLRAIQTWVSQFHAYWDGNSESLENYAETVEIKSKIAKRKKKP
jgi:DNA-binding transcriptional ArsR family regulator